MDKYFYLISQLPMLSFQKEPGIGIEAFLEESRKWLPAREYRLLKQVSFLDTDSDQKAPRAWMDYQNFERAFRTELAGWRRARKEGFELKTSGFPQSLVKEGNPLEVELKCLKWRWQAIERLEEGHHFDFDFLVYYYLKLQILGQLSLFEKEKGLSRYRAIRDSAVAAAALEGDSNTKASALE